MALTIALISIVLIACAVYAYKAKAHYPEFTDTQLLNQHCRFLDELDSSRKYIGATYFHAVEKGSPAEFELTARGYDVKKLLQERMAAGREDREIHWRACRLPAAERKAVAPPQHGAP